MFIYYETHFLQFSNPSTPSDTSRNIKNLLPSLSGNKIRPPFCSSIVFLKNADNLF